MINYFLCILALYSVSTVVKSNDICSIYSRRYIKYFCKGARYSIILPSILQDSSQNIGFLLAKVALFLLKITVTPRWRATVILIYEDLLIVIMTAPGFQPMCPARLPRPREIKKANRGIVDQKRAIKGRKSMWYGTHCGILITSRPPM